MFRFLVKRAIVEHARRRLARDWPPPYLTGWASMLWSEDCVYEEKLVHRESAGIRNRFDPRNRRSHELLSSGFERQATESVSMTIEVRSPLFGELIDPGVQIDRLATGFVFTEGPLWNAREGYLIFSDIPANQIKKWAPDNGISDFRIPSGKSNGLTYDKQGRLIACEHANRRVSRTEADGTVVTIADTYDDDGVKKLNSPNDAVVKSNGSVSFTDPHWGLTADFGELGNEELGYRGVYRLSPDGATLTLLTKVFPTPNCLCFSPDESVLYIDCTQSMIVTAHDVQSDGTIANGRTILHQEGEGGAPDGMKIDEHGNVYVTGPGGVWVCTSEGKLLGIIRIPEMAANLAWGGENWDTLFVTASTSLYRVPMKVRGIAVP